MSALKSAVEMDRIRAADAKLREKQIKEFVPEKNLKRPVAYFQIERYTAGSFRGLFAVSQVIPEDANGRPLKRPLVKTVADGVDVHVAMSSLETALRKKVFR